MRFLIRGFIPTLCWTLIISLGILNASAQISPQEGTKVPKTYLLPASLAELERQMREAYANRTSCKPEPPIEARLDLAQQPRFGQPVQLVFSVLPYEYLHNAEIAWDVDQGVDVLNKQAVSGVQLDTKGVSQFTLTVRFARYGEYEIAPSIVERGDGYTMGRRLHLYFKVTPQSIEVSDMPDWTPPPSPIPAQRVGSKDVISPPDPLSLVYQGTLPPLEQPHSDDQVYTPQGPGGTARIIGHFRYRHRDNTLHAAWNSVAQIWDRDTFSGDDLLAEVIIGSDAFFDSGNFDNGNDGDPFDGPQQDVYVRWLSRNGRVNVVNYDNNNVVIVGDVNVGNNISDGTHDIGNWFVDCDGPGNYPDDCWEAAFEICETLSIGWLHYNALGYDLALVNARWKPGGSDGAYYNGGSTRRISLTDGDQQDRSVILHEYGHHVMEIVKGGFPPGSGGAHSWFGCYNGGLAWSEGWATYSGQSTLANDTYCDTPGVGDTANFCVNIEDTTGNCLSNTVGTTGEASVASSLWDVYDNQAGDPHPNDRLALGLNEIFDTFRFGGVLNHMLDVVNAWFARGWDYDSAFRDIMRDHRILPLIDNFVTVEIDHTYRGDLVVDVGVGDPNRPLYVKNIWNRAGGGADNLYIQASVADAPAFYLTPSESVVWFCKVSDQAGADQGTLRRFSLTHSGTTYVSGNVPLPVNDFTTVYAYIPSRTSRHALVDIRHTWRGDLVVTVGVGNPNAPLFSRVVANRTGGSLDDMWCQVDLTSAAAFLPPTSAQPWWVKVEDQAGADQGTMNMFRISNLGTVYDARCVPAGIFDFQTTLVYNPRFTGDTNCDNRVDDKDLWIVLRTFGQTGGGLPGDLNGDGVVNNSDLSIALSNFGRGF